MSPARSVDFRGDPRVSFPSTYLAPGGLRTSRQSVGWIVVGRIAPASPEAPSLEEDGAVGRASQYPPELRERAVRMVVEVTPDYSSQ
jgi:hypothetical protein